MKICFVSLEYPGVTSSGGGVGMYVHRITHALVEAGHSVDVVALRFRSGPTGHDFWEDKGVSVHTVLPGNIHWYVSRAPFVGGLLAMTLRELEYSWALARKVRQIYAERPLDLIECSETSNFFLALGRRRIPLVIRLHGEEYTYWKWTRGRIPWGIRLSRILQRFAIRRAVALTAPSRAHAEEIRREIGLGGRDIDVIPNPVTPPAISPKATQSNGVLRVLYVGRLDPRKGLWVLLEAAHKVVQQEPGMKIILVGARHPSVSSEQISNTIKQLQLDRIVELTGPLDSARLAEEYARADVFVMPSYYETFSLGCAEAMAYGKPVIASRVGGLEELVQDGQTGLLIPPGDAGSLASAILQLLRQPQVRLELGRAAKEACQRLFSVQKVLEQTLQTYRSARASA